MIRIIALCVAFAVVAVGSPDAFARSAKAKQAKAHSKRALKYFLKGEFGTAAGIYQKAYAVHPAAKYLYNIGLCYYKLGRYGYALRFLERFRRKAPAGINPAYHRGANKRIKEIKRITQLITIRVSEVGAKVSVDGRVPVVAPLSAALRLRNGRHTLMVTKPGFLTTQRTFRVGPGQPRSVSVVMRRWGGGAVARRRPDAIDDPGIIPPGPPAPDAVAPGPSAPDVVAPGPPAPDAVTPGPGSGHRNKTWLWVGVAGGIAALAGEGMAWGMWGRFKGGDTASKLLPGYLYYTGHVLAGVGAGLAIAGLALYFANSSPERASTGPMGMRLAPVVSVSARGAYAGVGGTF